MARFLSVLVYFVAVSPICFAQVGGGSVYGQSQNGSAAAQANERSKRSVTKDEMPPAGAMFLQASILINVKADEYVAIFGINQEGATLEECNKKMDATVGQFSADLRKLGVAARDLDVDFVAQNRIYGYVVDGEVAKEKVTGFEVKKNVSVHYREKSLLDKAIAAASRSQIFDLIKVDYIVKDIDSVHSKLMQDAARVIKLKASNHGKLLGIKLRTPTQVVAERYSAYFPSEMYDSYAAYESEDVSSNYYRQKFVVQGARKARTFFFNELNAKSFDNVLNPVVIEPVVQFTLFLKLKFSVDASDVKTSTGALKAVRPSHSVARP